jgi:hypothetical protein
LIVSSLALIPKRKALVSIALNASKLLGLSRSERACCRRLADAGVEGAAAIAMRSHALLAPYLGDVRGKTGLEIGPGDNLGVADCFLAAGAARVICVEQFHTVQRNEAMRRIIHDRFGAPCRTSPELIVAAFETISPDVDFIYSIDVLEHVADIGVIMKHIARLLPSSGVSAHAVDFSGHNVFADTGIDFLTCPDWAWNVMHSHLETTNRIRLSEVTSAGIRAGLRVEAMVPTKTIPETRVEELRPLLNPRFSKFPASELCVLEAIVVFRAA